MNSLSIHSDEHFMKIALQQAEQAYKEKEIPIGAVVVSQNRIIAKAYNQVQRLNDSTAHAEMLAITSAQNNLNSKYLTECTLYVTLEPCTMCAGALFWSQIGKLVIAARDESRGYSRLTPSVIHPKTEVSYGLHAEDSETLIKAFFKEMRRNNF